MGFEVGLGGAALAGILAFFSPCVLPMVPFYLGYLGGLTAAELRGARGTPAPGAQARIVLAAALFALGVTTIFVLLGLGATALGQVLRAWLDELRWLAAAVIAVFGLHLLGVLRLPLLLREARAGSRTDPGTLGGAYLMGLAFGFGWSACVGPVLASILMIAAGRETLAQGGLLLAVFGLAMTLPFVVVAAMAPAALGWLARTRGLLRHAERAMGLLLLVFALLIATDSVGLIADWMLQRLDWSWSLR
jgi:cytochrome c-type biogenesis protein